MRPFAAIARRIRRRNGLTKQDKTAPKFPDLLKRDFTASAPNTRWVGDMTEIPAGPDGRGTKLYLATVIDLYSRRLLGAATGLHPDADLTCSAIKMAVAARGGKDAIWRDDEAERVIFHTDHGSTGGFNWSSQHLDDGGVLRWQRWFRHGGGMSPISLPEPSGRYLSFAEREEIAVLNAQDQGVREIARRLGRDASTISRELRRNAATRDSQRGYRRVRPLPHPRLPRLGVGGRGYRRPAAAPISGLRLRRPARRRDPRRRNWLPGELRMWTQRDDGSWWGNVEWVPKGEPTRRLKRPRYSRPSTPDRGGD